MRFTRSLAVFRMRRHLERESYPRIQMGLIVTLTGATGLLWSFLLLHSGVESMALRYPLALAGAYLVFLFLLWLWLRTRADDFVDLPDLTNLVPSRSTGNVIDSIQGGGGNFGGGGANGSFFGQEPISMTDSEPLSSIGDAAGSAFDADELAIPIVAVLLAIGLALASFYVVYIAPVLFAELLIDGALSYTLYRRWRGVDHQHWLTTALRRTMLPFGLTAVFLALVGVAMAAYAPGARSIGEVMHHAHASR